MTRLIGHHRGVCRDDDLLLAVLVFDGESLAVIVDHRFRNRRVGHGAVGLQVERTKTFAGAALRLGKDVDLDRLLTAVGLRHAGCADV
ncbi:MAG: hypothetical protein JO237_13345 [Pseudolabrys sp.]|nr:hypothetical protein [Pseudolabrys sp.]